VSLFDVSCSLSFPLPLPSRPLFFYVRYNPRLVPMTQPVVFRSGFFFSCPNFRPYCLFCFFIAPVRARRPTGPPTHPSLGRRFSCRTPKPHYTITWASFFTFSSVFSSSFFPKLIRFFPPATPGVSSMGRDVLFSPNTPTPFSFPRGLPPPSLTGGVFSWATPASFLPLEAGVPAVVFPFHTPSKAYVPRATNFFPPPPGGTPPPPPLLFL